jgi:hypothetical protein
MDITGIGAVSDLIGTVVSRIWPDKSESDKQQLAAAVMIVQGQLDINRAEAASPSVFVSGWRPAIGWVCGAACAWNWIGLPMAKAGLLLSGTQLDMAPADLTEMLPILLGMLGLAGLRTGEKIKGVAAQ